MFRIHDIHHISLLLADTARALAFYHDLLGLELDPARPVLPFAGAWLRIGKRALHLLELPNPDLSDGRPAHGGRDRHLALSVANLDALRERLEAAGIGYSLSRLGRHALFCRDPDGNALEWQCTGADRERLEGADITIAHRFFGFSHWLRTG